MMIWDFTPDETPEPEIEVIDRTEEENGDYSFTLIVTWPDR